MWVTFKDGDNNIIRFGEVVAFLNAPVFNFTGDHPIHDGSKGDEKNN